jgi:hypothetical protein
MKLLHLGCPPHPGWSIFLFFLHPFATPHGWLKWVWPELDLMNDLSIAHCRKCNRASCDHAIGHSYIGDNLIIFCEDLVDREFPTSMRRVMLIDGNKIYAPTYLLTGLRPLENVVIVQEFASGFEVVRLHRGPECLDHLFIILGRACHQFQLYDQPENPSHSNGHPALFMSRV